MMWWFTHSVSAHMPYQNFEWEKYTPDPSDWIDSVHYANGRFVAVGGTDHYIGGPAGSAIIHSSANGTNWITYVPSRIEKLSDSSFGNDIWVATGDDGGIFTSYDGDIWIDHSLPPTTHDLDTIVFGNGNFFAFSYNRNLIYTSSNGTSWSSFDTTNTADVLESYWLNNHFVAVGDNGTILFSNDGHMWSSKESGTTEYLWAAAYGKGLYVVGGYFLTLCSTDGETWTSVDVPFQVKSLVYDKGWFYAFGTSDTMLISPDGINWQQIPSISTIFWIPEVTVSPVGFVALCDGSIYYSRPSTNEPSLDIIDWASAHALETYGESGVLYRLNSSSNLIDWEVEGDWKSGTEDFLIWSDHKISDRHRFFRTEKNVP